MTATPDDDPATAPPFRVQPEPRHAAHGGQPDGERPWTRRRQEGARDAFEPVPAGDGARRAAAWIAVLLVGALVAAPLAAYRFPPLLGADESYVVLSGSMEPTFAPGDIIYNERVDPEELAVGDVITFQNAAGQDYFTHRIVGVERDGDDGQLLFRTKGDANKEPDPRPVPADRVQSRYRMHAPLLGYVVAYSDSPAGFLLMVVLPGLAIIALQARRMLEAFREMEAEEERAREAERARRLAELRAEWGRDGRPDAAGPATPAPPAAAPGSRAAHGARNGALRDREPGTAPFVEVGPHGAPLDDGPSDGDAREVQEVTLRAR